MSLCIITLQIGSSESQSPSLCYQCGSPVVQSDVAVMHLHCLLGQVAVGMNRSLHQLPTQIYCFTLFRLKYLITNIKISYLHNFYKKKVNRMSGSSTFILRYVPFYSLTQSVVSNTRSLSLESQSGAAKLFPFTQSFPLWTELLPPRNFQKKCVSIDSKCSETHRNAK